MGDFAGFAMLMKLAPSGFRLSRLLDYFIPAEMQVNAESHRRARMFMLSHVFGPILGNSIPLYMAVMEWFRRRLDARGHESAPLG